MTPILELDRDLCTMHLPWKFHHPVFTRSEVIVLTNTWTHKQTDAAENIQRSSLYATTLGKNPNLVTVKPRFWFLTVVVTVLLKTQPTFCGFSGSTSSQGGILALFLSLYKSHACTHTQTHTHMLEWEPPQRHRYHCVALLQHISVYTGVIFVNENENGEKRENNEFVNEN